MEDPCFFFKPCKSFNFKKPSEETTFAALRGFLKFKIMARAKKTKSTPPPPPAVLPKKTAGKRKPSGSQRTYIKRVCKDSDLSMVNRDGLQIVEGAYRDFLTGLLNHTETMIRDDKRRLTRETGRLAFIGYMDKLGAATETTQEALERADTALKNLFPSE